MSDASPVVTRRDDDGGPTFEAASTPPKAPWDRLPANRRLYVIGAAVAVAVLALVAVVRLRGSSTNDSDAVPATAPAAAPAPAPTATPVPTTNSPEQDAARRVAFVQTMTRLGLTEAQGNCVADKVAEQVGWSKLGVNLMEGENAKLLERLMLSCVKPR